MKKECPGFDVQAALGQAIQYHMSDSFREAGKIYSDILNHDPENCYAFHSLGVLALQGGKYELAHDYIGKAIKGSPDNAVFHNNMGLAFVGLSDAENAIYHFRKATALNPNYAEAFHNLGNILKDQCRIAEAIECQSKAIELRPDYAEAHFNRSISLLLLGKLREGLKGYEWRWRLKGTNPRRFIQPIWDGSDLHGRTILLHAEQGLGDTIQFIRYAKVAKERGASVIAAVQDPLVTLLKACDYIDSAISWRDTSPDFDVQAPIMSLLGILGTTLETIAPGVPYIDVSPGLEKLWNCELAGDQNLKIGLCWKASTSYEEHHSRRTISSKSIPLTKLHVLAEFEGISLYNLQKEVSVEGPPGGVILHDFGPEFDRTHGRFMDTAAVMKNLDLVITIDTAIAHLAGALGVPVWVLLPYVPDWRWFLAGDTSPWYPTMRLFRQPRPGDWDSVIREVSRELSAVKRSKLSAGKAQSRLYPGRSRSGVKIEVSPGEFLDKLVILRIKSKHIGDPAKLENVRAELVTLQCAYDEHIPCSAELEELIKELLKVNEKLWKIEDAIREKERDKRFDREFIELARNVYLSNDHRAKIKRKINSLLGSKVVEEKSYADY